ncbi:MAG: ScyD/ScyE family protein [Gemmatimonadales bacterium]
MTMPMRLLPRRMRPLLFAMAIAVWVTACESAPTSPPEAAATDPAVDLHRGHHGTPGTPTLLLDGLEGASGSAVGPDHQLYVTEGAAGKVSRINPRTGAKTTFASGLPASIIGIGGAIDVAFLGRTAYVLVTVVDDPTLFPTGQVNGIYRIDGPNSFTVIADIGAYNIANPPTGFPFFVSTGVQYALTPYRDGFLVTDGHMNRVLRVTRRGDISVYRSFGDIVPTGIENEGRVVYMAEAGPVPHDPADGKIVALGHRWGGDVREVAVGCRLCVDVKRGRGGALFGLAQGVFGGGDPGAPALPNTGKLLRVNRDGSLSTVAEALNIPTSMEFIGNTAYIISLAGEIWTIDNVEGGWDNRGHDRRH